MTSGARVLLQYCDVGVMASWEKAHPGARASRPQPYSCKQHKKHKTNFVISSLGNPKLIPRATG